VLRLVTIPISHYCEKARWGLQRASLPFREEPHVQGLHQFYARRAGASRTVPVLVTPDGAIGESEQILEYCDRGLAEERRLFPADHELRRDALALSRRFDTGLGPAGRRLIYVRMFAQPQLLLRYNNQGVPSWEAGIVRHGLPVMQRLLGRFLGIRPGVEQADEALCWREFDHVAELLADGRAHLLGERFTVADLTFAALSAPLVMPACYGCRLPRQDELDDTTASLLRRAREHPAGAYALRLSEHRTWLSDRPDPEEPA
jgi:glutathione S-transferase